MSVFHQKLHSKHIYRALDNLLGANHENIVPEKYLAQNYLQKNYFKRQTLSYKLPTSHKSILQQGIRLCEKHFKHNTREWETSGWVKVLYLNMTSNVTCWLNAGPQLKLRFFVSVRTFWVVNGIILYPMAANHQIKHQAMHTVGSQPGDCWWPL